MGRPHSGGQVVQVPCHQGAPPRLRLHAWFCQSRCPITHTLRPLSELGFPREDRQKGQNENKSAKASMACALQAM